MIKRLFKFLAIPLCSAGCHSGKKESPGIEVTLTTKDLTALDRDSKKLHRLDQVMGTLLETWDNRYTFRHDRDAPKLTFTVPEFTLTVVEDGVSADKVALLFEEAGTSHRVECTAEEAPKIIEALLFP